MLKISPWHAILGLKICRKYVYLPTIWRKILLPAYLVFAILFNVVEFILYAVQTVMYVFHGKTTFKEAYKFYVENWKYGYEHPYGF